MALDMVCIQAAGCDLAIAIMGNMGFRDTGNQAFNGMVGSLLRIFQRAQRDFKGPWADGLVALMDVQVTRILAACMPVRNPLLFTASWHGS